MDRPSAGLNAGVPALAGAADRNGPTGSNGLSRGGAHTGTTENMGVRRRLAIAVAALAAAVAFAWGARAVRPRPALPDYGPVASFRLVDQAGAPFTSETLRGHVTVVDFVFTRCTASCPRLTSAMASLQRRAAQQASRVKLVSFSVDLENDTPAVLTEYAARAGADARRWSFVTGPVDDVVAAVVGGFKMSAAKIARGAEPYDVVHGNWFVLVDPRGNVRGYYPSETEADLEALMRDVARLERAGHGDG